MTRAAALFAFITLFVTPVVAQPQASLRERMIGAEDRRAQTEADLATLRQGLSDRDSKVRRQAARAIGRLERPELIRDLTRLLTDTDPGVRAEAVNAIGQSARGDQGVADAQSRLLARAKTEQDPFVWGVMAATLGRLAYKQASDVDQVETVIAAVLPGAASTAIQIDAVLGATEGLEALARVSGKISKLKASTLNGLRAASVLEGRAQDADKLARIRRFATLALVASGAATRRQLEAWLADPDDEMRRLAMIAARAEIDGRETIVTRGMADPNGRVRYEALQTWGRQFQKTSCEPVISAVRDDNPHVSLLAIDLLGNGCAAAETAVNTVRALAEMLTPSPGRWHAPAHAIVSLAKIAPTDAAKMLPRYVSHGTWQVRMYAARAAGALRDTTVLQQLARDAHDNVREAALDQLIALKSAEAVPAALDALSRPDYQLTITAARALASTADTPKAVDALTAAYKRIAADRRDTARDALVAIAERLTQLGAATAALPAVATAQASASAATTSLSAGDLDPLTATRLRFHMAGRGPFVLRLLVDEAPVTAAHIAALARKGYYNGLTFHRVVPNFVIQGGSPGANEYMGQGPFMRDEVGLVSHRRGTVGISTRGRDTGDAQIFINLVDLPRLDHTYTVFAEVVSGMEVVDAIVEGDVIDRVEIVSGRSGVGLQD